MTESLDTGVLRKGGLHRYADTMEAMHVDLCHVQGAVVTLRNALVSVRNIIDPPPRGGGPNPPLEDWAATAVAIADAALASTAADLGKGREER